MRSVIAWMLALVGVFLNGHTFAQTTSNHSITMVTYYPAPTGNYDQLFANNIGIGSSKPSSRLDVEGDTYIKGNINVKGLKINGGAALVTVVLFDPSGVRRECPAGYKLIGQWVVSNGTGDFNSIDSQGNQIPGGMSGVMGLCSAI